jgi:hypothetical protein
MTTNVYPFFDQLLTSLQGKIVPPRGPPDFGMARPNVTRHISYTNDTTRLGRLLRVWRQDVSMAEMTQRATRKTLGYPGG